MGVLEWVGGDPTDPASWQKLPRPILTGGGHGSFVEVDGGLYAVYHRKLTSDPGWGDRVIRSDPLTWDSAGYPVIGRQGGRGEDQSTRPSLGPHLPIDRAAEGPGA